MHRRGWVINDFACPRARTIINMNHGQTRGERHQDFDELGRLPIHIVAAAGDCASMQSLICDESRLNAIDLRRGATPLIWAAVCRHPEMIALLLDSGADPNLKDRDGKTALIYVLEAFAELQQLQKQEFVLKAQYRNLCFQLLRAASRG